jgi:hypothetical protein
MRSATGQFNQWELGGNTTGLTKLGYGGRLAPTRIRLATTKKKAAPNNLLIRQKQKPPGLPPSGFESLCVGFLRLATRATGGRRRAFTFSDHLDGSAFGSSRSGGRTAISKSQRRHFQVSTVMGRDLLIAGNLLITMLAGFELRTIVRGSHDTTMQRGRTDAFDLDQLQARPRLDGTDARAAQGGPPMDVQNTLN